MVLPLLDKDVHPLSAARTKEFMLAVGLAAKGTLDTDKLVGKAVQVRLKNDTDQDGDYRPKVGKVMALPEADEPEDEAEEEPEAEGDEEEMDLDALDRKGLKAVDQGRGPGGAGAESMSDDDIRKAIIAAWPEDEEEEDEPEDEEEEAEDETEAEADDDGYDDMNVADLKAELKERELPTNGARKVLTARLRADDNETSCKPLRVWAAQAL